MANTIALRKAYATMLDEVYKLASLTAVLDGPNELVKEGANANEILIPKMTMSGLANYNKQTGYVAGDVTLEYETKKCTYDGVVLYKEGTTTEERLTNVEDAVNQTNTDLQMAIAELTTVIATLATSAAGTPQDIEGGEVDV